MTFPPLKGKHAATFLLLALYPSPSWFGSITDGNVDGLGVVEDLHNILKPFLLRRVKSEVEVKIPEKIEFTVACPMTRRQAELYAYIQNRVREQALETTRSVKKAEAADEKENEAKKDDSKDNEQVTRTRRSTRSLSNKRKLEDMENQVKTRPHAAKSQPTKNSAGAKSDEKDSISLRNVVMQMRKVANHPALLKPLEEDLTLDTLFHEKVDEYQPIVKDSGKMLVLGMLDFFPF